MPTQSEQLRDDLLKVFQEVKLNPSKENIAKAKALSDTARAIIASARAELEYHLLRDEKPSIQFLGGEQGGDKPVTNQLGYRRPKSLPVCAEVERD